MENQMGQDMENEMHNYLTFSALRYMMGLS